MCKDLEHSFNLQKYDGAYDKFVEAMDRYEQLKHLSEQKKQEAFFLAE